MLSQKQNRFSKNPLINNAIQRVLTRKKQTDIQDGVALVRRAGIEPDAWQADVLRSKGHEILLLCSRQSGKSSVTSWLAGLEILSNITSALVLILAPSLRQAKETFRKTKDFLLHFPESLELEKESALELEFKQGARLVCLPGQEANVRGFSAATLLIVDEAARVLDSLYFSIRPMLAVSGGRIVLLSSAFGKRGFFFNEWSNGGDSWHRVKVTAYECPRISKAWLEKERNTVGDWWFSQEYLCEFLETDDQLFRFDDINAMFDDNLQPLFEA